MVKRKDEVIYFKKFTAHIEGSWGMEIDTSVQETMVNHLIFLDSHTSRSLWSYGSD